MRITLEGHGNITCNHKTTLAVTKDSQVSKRGDCFIGVNAVFNFTVKDIADKKLRVTISCNGEKDTFTCHGCDTVDPQSRELVLRKSDFKDAKTLCTGSSKAASDLKESLKTQLAKPGVKIIIEIEEL